MNRFLSFVIGFCLSLLLCFIGTWLLAKEVERQHNSTLVAGYATQISTLAFILSEESVNGKNEISRAKLCQDISIVEEKLKDGEMNATYVEAVVSKSVSDFQLYLLSLKGKHCA